MLNKKLKLYLGIIYVLGLISFVFTLLLYISNDMIGFYDFTAKDILLFILLEAFSESLIIKYSHITISTAFAVTTAALVGFGTFGGLLVVAFGVAFRIIKHNGRYIHLFNTPSYKTLFNMSNMTISTFLSGYVYYKFGGNISSASVVLVFIKFVSLSFIFLIVNSIIISSLIYILSDNLAYKKILLDNLKLGFLNIVFVSPLGLILIILYNSLNILGILAIIIPVILLRHIFKLYIQ